MTRRRQASCWHNSWTYTKLSSPAPTSPSRQRPPSDSAPASPCHPMSHSALAGTLPKSQPRLHRRRSRSSYSTAAVELPAAAQLQHSCSRAAESQQLQPGFLQRSFKQLHKCSRAAESQQLQHNFLWGSFQPLHHCSRAAANCGSYTQLYRHSGASVRQLQLQQCGTSTKQPRYPFQQQSFNQAAATAHGNTELQHSRSSYSPVSHTGASSGCTTAAELQQSHSSHSPASYSGASSRCTTAAEL
jgi:hypothetical protein